MIFGPYGNSSSLKLVGPENSCNELEEYEEKRDIQSRRGAIFGPLTCDRPIAAGRQFKTGSLICLAK